MERKGNFVMRWLKLSVMLVAVLGLYWMWRPALAQQEAAREADKAWDEKSYLRALELYRKGVQNGTIPNNEQTQYRIAMSLGKTEQWDAAIATGEELAKKAQFKARTYYWLARLYNIMPHQGYKVGGKIYRGNDYPKTDSAEKPQQIYIGEEDMAKALDYFERAKEAAQAERARIQDLPDNATPLAITEEEEINLNFDLAAFLPTRLYGQFMAQLNEKYEKGEVLDETIDLKQRYSRDWMLPKKVLYLYNEVRRIDNSQSHHRTVLSLLAKGLYVQSYQSQMSGWSTYYDPKLKKSVVRSYPYDDLQPIAIWQSAIDDYPNDQDADRVLYLIGQTYQNRSDLVKALATYQLLVKKYSKSKWVSDAKMQIRNITHHEISVDTMTTQKPGETSKITVYSRNVGSIEIGIYKVKLEEALTQQPKLDDYNTQFTSFNYNFGSIDASRKFFGPQVAHWTYKPKPRTDYQGQSETLDTPVKETGTYVVVADAGEGVKFARVLIISDLAILKKVDRDDAFAYIADARTGKPVSEANVVIKERYYQGNSNRVDWVRLRSDERGFASKKLKRERDVYNTSTEVFAWSGDRYAMTSNNYWYGGYGYGDNRDELKIYSYTDRPVYRPGQKVYFRQLLTQRIKGGDLQPAKSIKVHVAVANPKGEQIFKQDLTTSEFGSINGEFNLPAETPLGEYAINAWVDQSNQNISASGGNRFRVEEYKRPEYQVTVEAPREPKKPGETVAARINARYYFGAPVPNASVKYTVRRSTWWASYHFPQPFEWLYQYWGVGDYSTGRRNIGGEGSGVIVKEGTIKTDTQGIAEVTFQTTAETYNPNEWWRYYSNPLYTIEAEVTDASRRTVEAQGQVRVANQQYFAFLDPKRGYYRAGDRVQLELATQDANDQPFSASGKMVVYKKIEGNREEKFHEEAIKTDEHGRAFWNWQPDVAGQFRIAYEATDAWGKPVVGSTTIWVAGPGLDTAQFHLQGVTIILEKRYYQEDDSAKVLLIADQPDSTILLTQEAGGETLKRELVYISGRNQEITIPIRHAHIPNFALAAALVKNYEVYQAQEEIFVPPARAFVNVSVQGNKAEYKPGEQGTFTVKATDWEGKPVRTEVSLGLTDASLFYIQKDYAPDIRLFHYGERRAISTNLDSHRSGQPQGNVEYPPDNTSYETHGWELPDDMGLMNWPPGGGYYGYYGRRRGIISRYDMSERDEMAANGIAMGGGMAGPPGPMGAPGAPVQLFASSKAKMPSANYLGDKAEKQDAGLAQAQVRSNFAETAFWTPAVVTEDGSAQIKVTFPDSLTQWHALARGITTGAQVGAGDSDVETKKNLLVRLQSPRFFVERDQVVISGNVHNYLKTDKRVKVNLQLDDKLKLSAKKEQSALATGINLDTASDWVDVKAGEEARINWIVNVAEGGPTSVQLTAQTDEESDAVKMQFPVLVHGVQRFTAQSGVMRQGDSSNVQRVTINLPKERRFGASTLNLQLSPSLAATMLDALPYLADYPYGCVEQTMSRFLPSALVAKTLTDSGIDLKTLQTRAAAYEKEAHAPAIGDRVQNTGYSYPKGMPNARDLQEMSSQLWYYHRRRNPVYDPQQLQAMVNDGLNRLYNMQRSDGGWGWWQGSPESDPYMSAYVMYGLATARTAEVKVRSDVLERGFGYLQHEMKEQDNLHLLTYIAYSLSLRGSMPDDIKKIVSGRLYEQRERLTAYSKSLLAMALYNVSERDKAGVLIRNIENTAKIDEANGTARWRHDTRWWCWWNNDVETNAIALRAFLLVDPKNRLVPMMMKWLTQQARSNHWRSTKETAEAVYALADYVRRNRELDVDYSLTVKLNGRLERSYHVTSENALYFDNRFIAGDLFLQDGANELTIEKHGRGNVYWMAASECFSLEEPIKSAGYEIAVKRRYYKLTRPSAFAPAHSGLPGHASVAQDGMMGPGRPPEPEYKRVELKDGESLQSGDLVEVELILDSANDYEYLVFEDMKAAGLEPVDLRSGYGWGDGLSSNVELRDTKVAFFVDRLPQGTRVLRYRMRAEIPGRFHALPTNGYAMYAPEVRAISDEQRLGVHD